MIPTPHPEPLSRGVSAESIAREALRWAEYPDVPENLRGFLVGLAKWLRAPDDGPSLPLRPGENDSLDTRADVAARIDKIADWMSHNDGRYIYTLRGIAESIRCSQPTPDDLEQDAAAHEDTHQ